jgi:fused signal recognition particle receptor
MWGKLLAKTNALFESFRQSDATDTGQAYFEDRLESLEEALFRADVDGASIQVVLDALRAQSLLLKNTDPQAWQSVIMETLAPLLETAKGFDPNTLLASHDVLVLMLCGVNGSGKTTTLAKLAHAFKEHHVFVIGTDTFRAAADAQLVSWCNRVGVPYFTQEDGKGSSPSAVAFQGIEEALKQRGSDKRKTFILVDTSGRLHVDAPLMEELAKVKRSLLKALDAHADLRYRLKSLLVIDGTTGRNALPQVKQFDEAVQVDGLICTKLDASAKGGALLSIAHHTQIPTIYLTAGESVDALHLFQAEAYLNSLI